MRFALLVFGLLLFGTSSTATANTFPPKIVTGVSYASENHPATFQRIHEAGARFVHRWIVWQDVAPRIEPAIWNPRDPFDPNYRWGTIDRWVRGADDQGLTPLLQFYSAPQWAQRCEVPEQFKSTRPACNPDPDKLADFITAAVSRYSGRFPGLPRVRYWQPQNEPNLSFFFLPQFGAKGHPISPGIYRDLLNRSYDAIKAVNRSNIVLAAGLAPIGRPGVTVGPMEFTRRLLCMTGRKNPKPIPRRCRNGVKFDVFDMHPYTTGGPTRKSRHPDDVQMGDLGKLVTLLRAADRAGRIKGMFKRTPLWITEMSWDSNPPDPGGVRIRVLSRWTSETIFRAWQAGVGTFFWYSLRDRDTGDLPFSQTTQSGLFFRGATIEEDRPKPSLQAFRFPFVAFSSRRSVEYWGRTPTSTKGRVVLQVRQGGKWKRISVVRANRFGIFQGTLPVTRRLRPNRGHVRAVYRRERSLPFGLRKVKDFYQPPFG